ncbi:hypothetical protein GOV08_04960 [Candidatus Woesearchaeota archaeon]|nr:hypothetical protein [Candidatus Woesearchaeota archaeon]
MARSKEDNKLRIKIDFDGFRLDVKSDNPNRTLNELSKLIISKKRLFETMAPPDGFELFETLDELDIGFDLRTSRFSKELKDNPKSIETIRNLLLKYKNFLYRKESLDLKQEIDLNNKKVRMVIEKKDINSLINKVLFDISPKSIKHTFIHVIGDYFTKDHQSMLLDELKKKTGFVNTTFLFTYKKIDAGLVAETLFFGDYPNLPEEE